MPAYVKPYGFYDTCYITPLFATKTDYITSDSSATADTHLNMLGCQLSTNWCWPRKYRQQHSECFVSPLMAQQPAVGLPHLDHYHSGLLCTKKLEEKVCQICNSNTIEDEIQDNAGVRWEEHMGSQTVTSGGNTWPRSFHFRAQQYIHPPHLRSRLFTPSTRIGDTCSLAIKALYTGFDGFVFYYLQQLVISRSQSISPEVRLDAQYSAVQASQYWCTTYPQSQHILHPLHYQTP